MPPLSDDHLYRALMARDARFDGVFYVGVTSTRIYCRPVCTAPRPRADRCRFFASAAAAERRGFRPCLRCRPELAPGSVLVTPESGAERSAASVDAVGRLARTACAMIAAGALDRGSLDQLAASLGVTARHLRRAVERELGASPVGLAQTRRLLTAKQLLSETTLPIGSVALASGFQSVRRFNALFAQRYRLAPGDLRRSARGQPAATAGAAGGEDVVRLTLAYRAPYDWSHMLEYLGGRATPGVEGTADGRYVRSVRLHDRFGVIAVSPAAAPRKNALLLELTPSLLPVLVPLLARVRRLLDLDADPSAIAAHLRGHAVLRPLVTKAPGLRVPGAMDAFELTVRAILGQQVTVRGATTLSGRLARLGEPLPHGAGGDWWIASAAGITHLPIAAERLAGVPVAKLTEVGLPRTRAECLRTLARTVTDGGLPELRDEPAAASPGAFLRRMTDLPGIGEWTAEYVAMRGLRWPDAFPHGDLGLRNAMGGLSPARLRAAAEGWRPWRAYAAQYLWNSLRRTT